MGASPACSGVVLPLFSLMKSLLPTHDPAFEPALGQMEKVLDLQTVAGRNALRIALDNVLLLDRKQLDYGSKNISAFGVFGVLVRLSDKIERLKHLMGQKRKKPQNESIRDSLQDISNYGMIAEMILTNKWPNE